MYSSFSFHMRFRRGRKSSSSSLSQASPFTPLPPQWSLKRTCRSRCGNTSSRSTSISRTPQNGGSGTGTSVRAPERAGASSGGTLSGPPPVRARAGADGVVVGGQLLGLLALLAQLVGLLADLLDELVASSALDELV